MNEASVLDGNTTKSHFTFSHILMKCGWQLMGHQETVAVLLTVN